MDDIELEIMDQNGQIYSFIKAYTEYNKVKFYLYENKKTKVKQCFSPFDIEILRKWRKNTIKVVETRL